MMRGMIALGFALATSLSALPASAATIIVGNTPDGELFALALASGTDLTSNLLSPTGTSDLPDAYIFSESTAFVGANPDTTALGIAGSSVQSFLLHLNTAASEDDDREARGGFTIALGAGEAFLGFTFADAALDATDAIFTPGGVIYPTGAGRGLETIADPNNDEPSLLEVDTATAGLVKVQYELGLTAPMPDQVRFFVRSAVPEPTSWAMMITGFGLIGGALRRRVPARAALA